MTVLKTALRIIALIIIMAVVGYVLFFVNGREQTRTHIVETPGVNNGKPTEVIQVPVVVHTVKEQASSSPQISVEYPQFPTLSATFNTAIEKSVSDRLNEFKQEASENYKARKETAPVDQHVSMDDFTFMARWQPSQINPHYVSFIIRFDSYAGGANGNQQLETYNYSVEKKASVSLQELFPSSPDLLQQLSTIAVRDLTVQLNKSVKETTDTIELVEPYKDGVTPIAENYKNFTFTENILTIYFPKYSVAAGAFGEMHVEIPFKEIK